jgi:hypothetical protein
VISGADLAMAVFVVAAFAAWAGAAAWSYLTLRRAHASTMMGALWGGSVILGGMLLTALLFSRGSFEGNAERRALEARATELAARAIAPGSALACLDAVASPTVEAACERALFSSSEQVAAALAYVNAQYSLLAAGVTLAERDPAYQPAQERLRRGLEQDRFGLVAQVLATRGCAALDCADLAVLKDKSRVLANMRGNAFAGRVDAHALAWTPDTAGTALAASPAQAQPPQPSLAAAPPQPATAQAAADPAAALAAARRAFDYPSSSSIPPISIMDPEKDTPPPAPRAEAPRKPPPPPRARAARETPPAPAPAPAQAPAAPQTIVPEASETR